MYNSHPRKEAARNEKADIPYAPELENCMVAAMFTVSFVHQSGVERIPAEAQHRCTVGRRLGKLAELKPCPFCGSPAELTGECDMVWVRCSNEDCWCQMVTRFDEPEEAIEEWNRRADNG